MRTLLLFALLLANQAAHAFYDSSKGKWINRDPIEEDGGANLNGFVVNSPVDQADHLGLITIGFYGADLWWTFPNYGNQMMDQIGKNVGATMFHSLSHEAAFQFLLKKLDTNQDGRYGPCDVKEPIKILGYSWGGISGVKLARKIKYSDKFEWKEVDVLATIDPVATLRLPPFRVPDNVTSLWNRYQKNGAGVPLPFHGRYLNLDDSTKTSADQVQLDPNGRDPKIDHVLIVPLVSGDVINLLR